MNGTKSCTKEEFQNINSFKKYSRFCSVALLTPHPVEDKPYKCDLCGKSVVHKKSLDAHMRSHTGEKPFKCELCGNAFAHKSNLNIHKRKAHMLKF